MDDNPQGLSNNALHKAVRKNDRLHLQRLLLEGTDVNILDSYGQTALFIAVRKQFFDVAKLLLNHGADVNHFVGDRSALHISVLRSNVALTRLLLDHGANPNLKRVIDFESSDWTEDFYPALHIALEMGSMDLIKMLFAHHADPNLTDDIGNSALHSLIEKSRFLGSENMNMELMKLLLEYLAYPDIKNYNGDSALHCAVSVGNINMVKKLLACGADPHTTNRYGHSVFLTATYDFERTTYNDDDSLTLFSKQQNKLSIVKALLEAGADLTATYYIDGRTALHTSRNKDIVWCLLENGASIEEEDNEGRTALHCSVINESDCMEPLLFAGANMNVRDNEGKSFIDICEYYYNYSNFDGFVAVLLKFAALNIKRSVTCHFDLNIFKKDDNPFRDAWLKNRLKSVADELEKLKNTKIEGVCLHNALKYSLRDTSILHRKSFRNEIEGDNFKKEFPQFYLITRMCVREAEILKPLVEELSKTFAFQLTRAMSINVPEEVCRLIIIELESGDMKNMKMALC